MKSEYLFAAMLYMSCMVHKNLNVHNSIPNGFYNQQIIVQRLQYYTRTMTIHLPS